jgi:hypothetical protein
VGRVYRIGDRLARLELPRGDDDFGAVFCEALGYRAADAA